MLLTKLLLASSNPGKLIEMSDLLADLPIDILTPQQIELSIEVDESGTTHAENAAIKARAYARASRMLPLGADSGLEVDVLAGLPGIRSARFSTKPNATDADRRELLLHPLIAAPHPCATRVPSTG